MRRTKKKRKKENKQYMDDTQKKRSKERPIGIHLYAPIHKAKTGRPIHDTRAIMPILIPLFTPENVCLGAG